MTAAAMILVEVVATIPKFKNMIRIWIQTTRICQTLPMNISQDEMWSDYNQF